MDQKRTRKGLRHKKRKVGPTVKSTKNGVKELLTRNDVKQIIKKETLKMSETKVTYIESGGGVSTTMSIVPISDVPLGDTYNNREGVQIYPTFLNFKFQLVLADSSNKIRVLLVQWNADSQPIPGDIFRAPTNPLTISGGLEVYARDKLELRHILYDKSFQLDDYHPTVMEDIKINLKEIKSRTYQKYIRYQEASTAGDAASSTIYLIVVSDSGASPHPSIYYTSQMYYHDF